MGSRFVGFMRWSSGALAGLTAAAGAAVGLADLAARFPVVRRFNCAVPARPGLRETTILHISDLHMFERQGFIVDFLARVARTEKFDMVISTGDELVEPGQPSRDWQIRRSNSYAVIAALQRRGCRVHGPADWRKGTVWTIDRHDGELTSARVWRPSD